MNNSFISKYGMLPPGSSVLCAVSGGADSMCLLHQLVSLGSVPDIRVAAAHFEHGIRGEESLRDSRFVKDYCEANSIPFFAGSADVPAYARENGISVEDAARKLRYEFLEKTAAENGFDRIATAHNADDNAETVLFNLTRGSGLKGLCGIPPVRGKIVRPILDMTRAEIEKYLSENSVPHVEDSSNACDDYSRNRIRHHAVPVLKEINPAFSESVFRSCELLRGDEEYLDSEAGKIASACTGGSISCSMLESLPFALASRTVRKLCGKNISAAHTGELLQFASGSEYGILSLPGLTVRRELGKLYFLSPDENEPAGLPERPLIPGNVLSIPEAGLTVEANVTESSYSAHSSATIIRLDYESISGGIVCSSRKPGDVIRPAGRGCTKKLKTLLLEAGLTQSERNTVPVFRDDKGIVAVLGVAVAERCRCVPGKPVLEILIRKE